MNARLRRALPSALLSIAYATAVSSCNSSSSNTPRGGDPRGTAAIVAAVGDSEAEVANFIVAAQRAGKLVRYTTVQSGSATHVFPPYAQVIRTESSLIVRAYSRMYVWPLNTVKVMYSDAPAPLEIDALPLVQASAIDARVASVKPNSRSKLGDTLCAECALLFGKPQKRNQPSPWQNAEDPWQVHPDYAMWNNGDVRMTAAVRGPESCAEPLGTRRSPELLVSCPGPYGGYGYGYYYVIPGGGEPPGYPNPKLTPTPAPYPFTADGGYPYGKAQGASFTDGYTNEGHQCSYYYYYIGFTNAYGGHCDNMGNGYYYYYSTPNTCDASDSGPNGYEDVASSVRKTDADIQVAHATYAQRLQELQTAIARNSIPDSAVEQNIDPQIQGAQRAFIRKIMLSLPPSARQHVVGYDKNGNVFANRVADLRANANRKPWRHLHDNMWVDPEGELRATPDDTMTDAERTAAATSCFLNPTTGSKTGGFVRATSCSTAKTFTATVDASLVSGPCGPSWCISKQAQATTGDTGYLLIGDIPFKAPSAATTDAGLQWSPAHEAWELYVLNSGSAPGNDNTAHTLMSNFQPAVFKMTVTYTSTGWYLTVSSPQATYTDPSGVDVASTAGQATTVIYREVTAIAQGHGGVPMQVPTTGSYFGVSKGTLRPLFTWSALGSAANVTSNLDGSRGLGVNSFTWGINLHSNANP